jgi:hypothetical protein
VNFRFCVLKDELAWAVRDSDIGCVSVGKKGKQGPEQSAASTSFIVPRDKQRSRNKHTRRWEQQGLQY